MKKRILAMAAVLVLCAVTLTGCSSEEKKADDSAALHVTMIHTYVSAEAEETLESELLAALPQVFGSEVGLEVNSVSSGDTEKDPMGAMAGMTKIAGMMSSGEMELWLCDSQNASRHGENGTLFVPLDELFTAQEQAELGITPVTVPLFNDDGEQTGEQSAPCGIDLSGCEKLTQLMYTNDVAAYVLIDSPHTAQAKEVIRWLLSAE